MITGKKNFRSGLLGKTLGHSYSPQLHALFADHSYKLFEKAEEDIEEFIKSAEFDGINVTIPYKKAVMPFLDEISEEAAAIGSVNTVVKTERGLCGYNTDIYGFETMLAKANIDLCGKKVLLLGSGGAAQTALYVAKKHGAEIHTVSRSGELNYGNCAELHGDAEVIINATPVGMYPNNGISPISLKPYKKLVAVADMIYNPRKTALIMEAEALGINAVSGLGMLVYQALRACELFHGTRIAESEAEAALLTLDRSLTNIILVGMPGCGKSTVGALLSQKLGRTFVDTDSEIEKASKMSCSDIITAYGEGEFRKRETDAAANAGKLSGAVIATGGGIVTVEENYPLLRQNAKIYFLKRDISALATDGRPITALHGKEELYRRRLPLYTAFADAEIEVTEPEETAEKIIKEHFYEAFDNKRPKS